MDFFLYSSFTEWKYDMPEDHKNQTIILTKLIQLNRKT